MDEKGRKIWACMLSILMVVSTLAIVGNTTAKQPDDVPSGDDENGIPNVQVMELRAETPVVYLDQNNRLVLSVSNFGNATALKVTANVTGIIPKVSEELISTEHFGALQPDKEKTRFIDWTPTTRGIHYIKVEIKYEYLTHNSPAEMVESPPTILSAGFPVIPYAGPPEEWGPSRAIKSVINFTNDPGGVRYRENKEIWVFGDLIIEPGAKLQLNDSVTLVMMSTYAGEYGITIQPSASFIISSPSRTTTIQSPSSNPTYTYPFHNYGTVEFLGANVTYTYGDTSDLSKAGGIINYPNSVCNLTDCHVELADTHSVVANNSELKIIGADTLVGRQDENTTTNVGSGITILGASDATTEEITVSYNGEGGIRCVNAENVTIKNNVSVHNNSLDGAYLDNSHVRIQNSTFHYNNGTGITTMNFSNVSVEDSDVHHNARGIYILQNSNVTVNRCNVFFNRVGGPYFWVGDLPHETGIHLNASTAIIQDCVFRTNLGSIYIQNQSYALIKNNSILEEYVYIPGGEGSGAEQSARGYGVQIENSTATIIGNNITESNPGIKINSSNDTVISENSIIAFDQSDTGQLDDRVGIKISNSSDITVVNNTIRDRVIGIYLNNVSNFLLNQNIMNSIGVLNSSTRSIRGISSVMSHGIITNNTIENIVGEGIYSEQSTLTIRGPRLYPVENETSYITTAGDIDNEVTFYTANTPLLDLSVYMFIPGDAVYPMDAGADYTINMTTGEIITVFGGVDDVGWEFFTYYNYTKGGYIMGNTYGIYLNSSSDVTIINTTISNSSLYDFYLDSDSHATALNTTFNKSKVHINDPLSNLTVQWYLHTNVINDTGCPVDGANIQVQNIGGIPVDNRVSGTDGWTRWIIATEYVQTGTPFSVSEEFIGACDGITTDFSLVNAGILDITLEAYSMETDTWETLSYPADYAIDNTTGEIRLSEPLPVEYWLYAWYDATMEKYTPHLIEASKGDVSAYASIDMDESKVITLKLTEWNAPVTISPLSSNGTHPKLVADEANNTLHLVWLDDRNGPNQIFYRNSTDNGITWNPEICLTAGANNTYDLDFANDGGHLAVVWEEKADPSALPYCYLKYSDDSGLAWNTFSLGMGSEPSVDIDGSNVYVAFRKWTAIGPEYVLSMVIRYGFNGGVQEVEFLNPMGSELEFAGVPAVAVNGNNIQLIIADYSIPYIYHWSSTDGGGNWTQADYFATYDGVLDADSIDIDMRNGNLTFGWNTKGQILTRNSPDSGVSWSGFSQRTKTLGTALHPQITIDSFNNVHMVWQDDRSGTCNTFYMMFDSTGVVLIPETRLVSANAVANPSIAVDANGSAHIIWQELVGGNWQLVYSDNK